MKHKLHKCDDENCFTCNGGLAFCEVCHLGEVELVSDECAGGLTQRALDGLVCTCAEHVPSVFDPRKCAVCRKPARQ